MSKFEEKKQGAPRGFSRRSFLGGSAVSVLGLGAMALTQGCSPKNKESDTQSSSVQLAQSTWGVSYPWPPTPPDIAQSDIEEALKCDVVVVGLGVSGVAAFRSAVEAGAQVIGFEKGSACGVRSSQYCYINGTMTKRLGLGTIDEDMLINDEWNNSAKMADYPLIRNFVRNQSDSFDWWVQGDPDLYIPAEGEKIDMMAGPSAEHPVTIASMSDPSIDYANEPQASYPTRLALSDHEHVVNANLQKGIDGGGKTYFGHFVEQLIMEEDGCKGVYVRNSDTGKYKKVQCSKGVILSAGGCGSNKEMVKVFYPTLAENGNFSAWPNLDVEGNPTNSGDAYKMGYWAGAAFSQMMAPMTHVMGGANDTADMDKSQGLTSPHLRLNYNGQRFMNEDTNCSDCEVAFDRQPQHKAFVIIDSHFDEQAKTCVLEFDASLADFDTKVDNKTIFKANTLEELFSSIDGMDADAALKSVEHYNALCASGTDADFGKQKKYLFPVQDGPFYAQRTGIGLCLTTMGGLSCDEYTRVISTERKPIAGLYVCGNAQGGRFAVKYPFKLSGASHAMALYYGKVAGESAAAKR